MWLKKKGHAFLTSVNLIINTFLLVQEGSDSSLHSKLCKRLLVRNAWPCPVRKMANTSCVDSDIFYKKLGEVKSFQKDKSKQNNPFFRPTFTTMP